MINPYEQFEIYKNIIIKEITLEFGLEYNEYIKNIFNSIKIIFETTPKEEYLNIKYYLNKYNLLERLRKYSEYVKLEQDKKKIYNRDIKPELDKWIYCFVDLNNNKDYDKISILFSNYHHYSILIDYFSSNWDLKLNSGCLSSRQKEYIISKRNEFLSFINKNGYIVKNFSKEMVDIFIKCRDQFVKRKLIQELLTENNFYISRISKIINDNNSEIISNILEKENPTCLKYIKNNGQSNKFIFLPISRLKRYRNKTIDVILIHEMLHFLQKYNDNEIILNEVLVQFKAIKIAKSLHDKGIYIFDSPYDAKCHGECLYEYLLPFIQIILNYLPSEMINKAIIEDNYYQFNQILGESISKYFTILQQLYQSLHNNLPFNKETLKEYNMCITDMTNYYLNNKINYKKRFLSK